MQEYFNKEETLKKEIKQFSERDFANEFREKLRDPNFLPSHEQVLRAISFWIKEDKFYDVCREDNIFEFLNEEYLNALSDYFVKKISEYGMSAERPLVVLEIGSGNGKLAHFLQNKIEEKIPGQVKVLATDSKEWKIKTDFFVEKLKHYEALDKYNPDIVIVSWMPQMEDSSYLIRQCKNVKEYILIGETRGGVCGENWKTWGYDPERKHTNETPPYKKDGFEEYILALSDLNIGRTDTPNCLGNSKTVSFRRKK